MIQFAWPWAFALLPLPYLIYRWLPKVPTTSAALWVPSVQPFVHTAPTVPPPPALRWRLAVLTVCWLLLMVACARPQWLGAAVELPVSGRDLMLAVDLSGSMEIADFSWQGRQVDRLTALKGVASAFIQRRHGDRLGLILFGDQPYVQVPLTFDHLTLTRLLNEAQIGLAGQKTAIGDAVGLAIKRLKNQADNQKVLILLTDGANTSGQISPEKAAELAEQAGLKIYTIGLGAESLEVGSFIFKRTVNPSADLDEKALRTLAQRSGGQYFRARDSLELTQIYQQLDAMEPVEKERNLFRPIRELYPWPLAAAGLLALLWLSGRLWHSRGGAL